MNVIPNKSLSLLLRILAVFASVGIFSCSGDPPSCADLGVKADWVNAERVCRAAFQKHQRVSDGVELALALLYQDRYDDVVSLSPEIINLSPSGFLAAQIQWVTGAALARLDQPERARVHLKRALDPATYRPAPAFPRLQARAALELAGVDWREGQLRAAHEYQSLAASLAAESGDRTLATYARLGLVDILRLEGDFTTAERELTELARSPAEDQPDRAVFLLKLGIAYNNLSSEGLAREPLTTALAAERSSATPRSSVLAAVLLNLSWGERRAGNLSKALEYVDEAAKLGAPKMDVHLNRGLALRDAGKLAEAAAALAAAQTAGPTGDWVSWVLFNRGEVDTLLGNPSGAERHFRQAIASIEQQRAASTPTAPAVSVRQREVYTALIGMLALQHRWLEVLEVIQRLDDGAMSQILVAPASLVHASSDGNAEATKDTASPAIPRASTTTLLDAWRSRWLLMLVRGGARMWRIQIREGVATGEDVGAAEILEKAAATLERDPQSRQEALLLGGALMPAQLAVNPTGQSTKGSGKLSASPQPVDVFLVGQVGRAPLSLLRDRSGLLRDRFSISRVLKISPREPSAFPTRPPVVLGDPKSDLPEARIEARYVAELLGVPPSLGEGASAKALEEARGASLLHVAAHTRMVEGRPFLQLADRLVPLTEIRALKPAPRLVVIGTCGSASERDQTLWGSLASAFLDAGSDAVVATTKSVPDKDARRVIEEFYRRGGLTDPARALAEAQPSLEEHVPLKILSAFVVLRAPPTARSNQAP